MNRLCLTVSIVRSTSSVRTSTGPNPHSGGRLFWISLTFSDTPAADRAAVGPQQHQRRADDHLAPVLAGRAGAQFLADAHAWPHRGRRPGCRRASRRRSRRCPRRVRTRPSARTTYASPLCLDEPRPGAGVVLLQRLDQIHQRQAVGHQLHRVGLHEVLLLVAADGIHAGHILHRPDLRLDRSSPASCAGSRPSRHRSPERSPSGVRYAPSLCQPGLPSAAVAPLPSGMLVLDDVHVNLAQAGGDRPHARLGARRQALRAPRPAAPAPAGGRSRCPPRPRRPPRPARSRCATASAWT